MSCATFDRGGHSLAATVVWHDRSVLMAPVKEWDQEYRQLA
ncbi:hypothetical protein [Desulfovibrio subterraneus]|nr:hypothetical protein [Desulfovibrio subterraneus]